VAARLPYFTQPVLASTCIPLREFISFHDELMLRFYNGQPRSYLSLGEQAARWAMTEGPYRNFIADKDFQTFVNFFPCTWSTYFIETTSYCTTKVEGTSIDFEAFDLPLWHPYFEYFVVGYFKGALDLVCANPIQMERVEGGSGTHYRYNLHAGAAGQRLVSYHQTVNAHARLSAAYVEKVAAFIEERLSRDITVSDLARLVGYSRDHLAKLFKSSFGVSLHQYVLWRRVERARGLLLDRDRPIAEVARACGFASQSHFTTVFKAKVGATPRAYRLRLKSH
jgi:AraC-like DNA-binding protein